VPRQPLGERRRRLVTRRWLVGVSAAVVTATTAGTGVAGGFDRVAAEGPPQIAVDEISHGQPWNVRVTRAILFDGADLEPVVYLDEESNHWLLVAADVEITTPDSRTDIHDVLFPTGIDGIAGDSGGVLPEAPPLPLMVLVRDDSNVAALHPGLPEQVAFLWERSSDAPPPAEIEVQIIAKTLRENFFDESLEWLDPAVKATVTVPLEDRRGDQ
jgi:hypothetical protein